MKISDIQHDSIQTIVCEPMDLLETGPLENGLDDYLQHLYENPEIDFLPFSIMLPPLVAERLELYHTLKLDKRTTIALVVICVRPAIVVMYLWYLQWVCFKRNIKELYFDTFYLDIFKNGYFKDEDLKKIWYSQKVIPSTIPNDSDNLVDYAQGGLSIQFK